MTRDETIALFLECEAKRVAERANALAEGKSEPEAEDIAHEAAKAHWNAWAEASLAEMKTLVTGGNWRVQRLDEDTNFAVTAANAETQEWINGATCRLTNLYVETKGWHLNQVREEGMRLFRRRKLEIESEIINLSGFIFPWSFQADFSFFAPELRFDECIFYGPLLMYECEFYNRIFFHAAKFLEGTRFNGSVFNSRATFINSKFYSTNAFARAIFKRYAVTAHPLAGIARSG
jgi:hypothetical protein